MSVCVSVSVCVCVSDCDMVVIMLLGENRHSHRHTDVAPLGRCMTYGVVTGMPSGTISAMACSQPWSSGLVSAYTYS